MKRLIFCVFAYTIHIAQLLSRFLSFFVYFRTQMMIRLSDKCLSMYSTNPFCPSAPVPLFRGGRKQGGQKHLGTFHNIKGQAYLHCQLVWWRSVFSSIFLLIQVEQKKIENFRSFYLSLLRLNSKSRFLGLQRH